MSEPTKETIQQALRQIKYPGFSRDIVSFGLIKDIAVDGGTVEVNIEVATRDPQVPQAIKDEVEGLLAKTAGVKEARAVLEVKQPPSTPGAPGAASTEAPNTRIPGVKHVVAVASGKGGVGKSTVAANLAVALARTGAKVGLCDCDIYGPSMALMFGGKEQPAADSEDRILPVNRYGIELMSMGFFLDDTSPAVLRGPMVTRYTQQFLRNVAWGNLDVLVLDLPPGTGDIQLTIVQTVALAGAVIVTTPQEVALIDARKASAMFEKVNVPVLGLIENMSYFLCPGDGKRYDIFGTGGGRREAERLNVPFLGEIPLDIGTREAGDKGRPIVDADPDNPVAKAFVESATKLSAALKTA